MTNPTEQDRRAAYTAGLRQLADILDAHPEVPLPYEGTGKSLGKRISFYYLGDKDPRAALAAARRAFGVPMEKNDSIDSSFSLTGSLAGLHFALTAEREAVCERVVVGTREVEVEEADPAAVAALPKVKRTVTVVSTSRWKTPPCRSAVITADDRQQCIDVGGHAEPTAWMWAPVTDGQQGEWQQGYVSWRDAFEAACAWLHAEALVVSGGAS